MHYFMLPLEAQYDDGFGALGEAFREAAQTVRKSNGEKPVFSSELPEIYLLRHAIELFLKSGIIIMHRRLKLPYGSEPHTSDKPMMIASSGKWKALFQTHDLPELYAYWKKLIVEDKDALMTFTRYQPHLSVPGELDGWINTLGEADPSGDYFRYPVSKNADADKEKSSFKEVSLESFFPAQDKEEQYVSALLRQGAPGESARVFAHDPATNKDVAEAARQAADMLGNWHAMMRFEFTGGS